MLKWIVTEVEQSWTERKKLNGKFIPVTYCKCNFILLLCAYNIFLVRCVLPSFAGIRFSECFIASDTENPLNCFWMGIRVDVCVCVWECPDHIPRKRREEKNVIIIIIFHESTYTRWSDHKYFAGIRSPTHVYIHRNQIASSMATMKKLDFVVFRLKPQKIKPIHSHGMRLNVTCNNGRFSFKYIKETSNKCLGERVYVSECECLFSIAQRWNLLVS